MKPSTLLTLFLCASSAAIAQSSYFPLQVGNRWILESTASKPELLNIEVLRSRVQNEKTYYLVTGYAAGTQWLRADGDGSLYALDENAGGETLLARLESGGPEYRSKISGCEQPVQPSTSARPYRGPNYETNNALTLTYAPGGCRDIGNTSEVYAPGLGLLQRSTTTFRGGITYNLVFAQISGRALVGSSKELVWHYDFATGSKGWLPGFSDYHLSTGDLRLLAELRALPEEINGSTQGFYLQGMNRSDDLFMFVKKQIDSTDGLAPNQPYRVAYTLRFASNAPTGCAGVGGSPGDAVYLKAGASLEEPLVTQVADRYVGLSIDKGQQSNGGTAAGLVGTIANGTACEGVDHPYVNVVKEYAHATPIRTDERGSMWLIVGTDSGYEGLTGLYLQSVTVRVNPWVEPAGR